LKVAKELRDEIGVAVKTGKVLLGVDKTIKNLTHENPKLVVVSSEASPPARDRILYLARIADVPTKVVNFNTQTLGSLCGRPHTVSALTVLEEGDSNILGSAGKK